MGESRESQPRPKRGWCLDTTKKVRKIRAGRHDERYKQSISCNVSASNRNKEEQQESKFEFNTIPLSRNKPLQLSMYQERGKHGPGVEVQRPTPPARMRVRGDDLASAIRLRVSPEPLAKGITLTVHPLHVRLQAMKKEELKHQERCMEYKRRLAERWRTNGHKPTQERKYAASIWTHFRFSAWYHCEDNHHMQLLLFFRFNFKLITVTVMVFKNL